MPLVCWSSCRKVIGCHVGGSSGRQLSDRVVEGEKPLVDHRERHRPGERLGHARDPHMLAGAQGSGGLHVGDARGMNIALAPALDHGDRPGRSLRQSDQVLQRAVQRPVGRPLTGGAGCRARYRKADERNQAREDDSRVRPSPGPRPPPLASIHLASIRPRASSARALLAQGSQLLRSRLPPSSATPCAALPGSATPETTVSTVARARFTGGDGIDDTLIVKDGGTTAAAAGRARTRAASASTPRTQSPRWRSPTSRAAVEPWRWYQLRYRLPCPIRPDRPRTWRRSGRGGLSGTHPFRFLSTGGRAVAGYPVAPEIERRKEPHRLATRLKGSFDDPLGQNRGRSSLSSKRLASCVPKRAAADQGARRPWTRCRVFAAA